MFAVIAADKYESRILINAFCDKETAIEVAQETANLGFYKRVQIRETPDYSSFSIGKADELISSYLTDNNLW